MIHGKKASFTSNLTKRQILENLVFSIRFTSTKNIPQIPNFPCENSRKTGGSIVVLTVLKTLRPTHFPTVFADSWHKENISLPYKLHSTDKISLNKQGDYSFIRIYWPSIGLVTMPVTPPTTPWNHNKTQLVSYTRTHPQPEWKRIRQVCCLTHAISFKKERKRGWVIT